VPIAGCTASEPQTVRCTTAHGEFARVDFALDDGEDLARGAANFDGRDGLDFTGREAGVRVVCGAAAPPRATCSPPSRT
jgi:hypothetical protein